MYTRATWAAGDGRAPDPYVMTTALRPLVGRRRRVIRSWATGRQDKPDCNRLTRSWSTMPQRLDHALSEGGLQLIPWSRVMNVRFRQLTLQGFPDLSGAPQNRAEAQPHGQRNQEPRGQADRHPPPRVHVRSPTAHLSSKSNLFVSLRVWRPIRYTGRSGPKLGYAAMFEHRSTTCHYRLCV